MADPDHVALARSGSIAIARWRELTFRSVNTRLPRFDLGYRLEDRAASETFTAEFVYGRPSLDLSGAFLSGMKLPGADLRHDDLSDADFTGCDFRMADLSGANLTNAHLFRASLPHVNLTGSQLAGCSLTRANLSNGNLRQAVLKGADLSYASLSYANLQEADLSGANLTSADLSWANVSRANLRGAILTTTSLLMADLSGADLRGARILRAGLDSAILHQATAGGTLFANCDLRRAIGLETMNHTAPSTIALDTLANSGGRIPGQFLLGAGVAEPLVAAQEVMKSERRTFPTTLLVGAMADNELTERLRFTLQSARIPAWILYADDEDALNTGEASLDYTVYYDRLALVCTDRALENPLTSRYFAELARAGKQPNSAPMIALGFGELLYQRKDRLCNQLRNGDCLDFRTREDKAIESLVRQLSAPVF